MYTIYFILMFCQLNLNNVSSIEVFLRAENTVEVGKNRLQSSGYLKGENKGVHEYGLSPILANGNVYLTAGRNGN